MLFNLLSKMNPIRTRRNRFRGKNTIINVTFNFYFENQRIRSSNFTD